MGQVQALAEYSQAPVPVYENLGGTQHPHRLFIFYGCLCIRTKVTIVTQPYVWLTTLNPFCLTIYRKEFSNPELKDKLSEAKIVLHNRPLGRSLV